MIRSYPLLPRVPDSGLLARYLDTLGVIVPLARINLISNPSLEYNDTGWTTKNTVTGAARSSVQSYHGAYSWAVTPSTAATSAAMNGGGGYSFNIGSPVASGVYAVSVRVLGAAGVGYRLIAENSTGPVEVSSVGFTGTGRWQWVWLVWQEGGAPTGQRVFWVTKNNNRDGTVFYLDGLQVEYITDGYNVPTTFIDGDQKGLVPNQYPPPYGWNGTPGGSSSFRTGQTRAGGRIVRFRDQGFLLTAILGLGLAPPQHEALTFAQLDGGQYENTLKPPRVFSLAGRVAAGTPSGADSGLGQLSRLLDRDLVAQRQPLLLTMQAEECGVALGDQVVAPALYAGGLEGNVQELPTQQAPITFQQYTLPVFGRDQGVALDPQDTIGPGGIAARSPGGTWAILGAGVSGGDVNVILVSSSGLIYVGGAFTNAGGTGADFIASYDPITGAWSALNSATALNGEVDTIVEGPNGTIYVGGNFTNASGIAAADFIAAWSPITLTWAAVGTGTNGRVRALAWVGALLYAGGDFTTAGGGAAARVASWSGSVWSALGTGAGATVRALAAGRGSVLYIGGDFTNGGGVAAADFIGMWTGTAWAALSTGMDAAVYTMALALNNVLYAAGDFLTAGGVAVSGIAAWNGVQWKGVGSGFASPGVNRPEAMVVRSDGTLLIATADAAVAPGSPEDLFAWNGSTFITIGIVPAGNGTAIAVAPDGTLYAAFAVAAAATVSGVVTATNGGTAEMYPTVTIVGPTAGTARLYELINATTNTAIYLNYTIAAGEIVRLTLNPTNVTLTSSFQGNIISAILSGSQTTNFVIQPGANRLLFLASDATVTATLWWPIGYGNVNDALYQAVTP